MACSACAKAAADRARSNRQNTVASAPTPAPEAKSERKEVVVIEDEKGNVIGYDTGVLIRSGVTGNLVRIAAPLTVAPATAILAARRRHRV